MFGFDVNDPQSFQAPLITQLIDNYSDPAR